MPSPRSGVTLSGDPRRSLAHRRDVAAHTGEAARRGAQRLRPSLRGIPAGKLAAGEIGIVIGRLLRLAVILFSSWEDTIVIDPLPPEVHEALAALYDSRIRQYVHSHW